LIEGYHLLLLQGFGVTLAVGVTSFLASIVIGSLVAWGQLRGSAVTRALLRTYSVCIRGIPELVTMLLIFYGVPTLLQAGFSSAGIPLRVDLNPFLAGVITLSAIYAAFSAEVIRGAVLDISKGQWEGAAALGLGPMAVMLRAVGPQIVVRALPGLANVWLVLLKATALMSVIQLEEIMRVAQLAARAERAPFYWFFLASLAYLAVALASMWLKGWLDRRAAYAQGT